MMHVVAMIALLFAGAPADKPRVSVAAIEGPAGPAIKTAITRGIERHVEIASEGFAARIEGKTVKAGKRWRATIEVYDAASGAKLESWTIEKPTQKALTQAVQQGVLKKLGPAIFEAKAAPVKAAPTPQETAPPPPPPPPPEQHAVRATTSSASSTKPAASTTVETPAPPVVERTQQRRALWLAVGAHYVTRDFKYKDDLFGLLRSYSLGGSPLLAARASWYPAAHFGSGLASNIGVDLGLEYGVGLASRNSANVSFPTRAYDFTAALQGRIPIGAHRIALFAGGGRQGFHIGNASNGEIPDIPSVTYTFLRGGAEMALSFFDTVSLIGGAAVRAPLSLGDISTAAWFPHASALGLDAHLVIEIEIAGGFGVSLGGELRRWGFSLKPKPGEPNVAGGALDQYLAGTAALVLHL
jgi:hypothetical protein